MVISLISCSPCSLFRNSYRIPLSALLIFPFAVSGRDCFSWRVNTGCPVTGSQVGGTAFPLIDVRPVPCFQRHFPDLSPILPDILSRFWWEDPPPTAASSCVSLGLWLFCFSIRWPQPSLFQNVFTG